VTPNGGDDDTTTGQAPARALLDEHEAARLRRAGAPGQERVLVWLLLDNGLRVSEAVRLDAQDVQRAGEDFVVAMDRHGPRRALAVPEWLKGSLAALVDGRARGPLLRDRYGQRMSRQQANRIVTEVAIRADLDRPISAHTLRRTAALRPGAGR